MRRSNLFRVGLVALILASVATVALPQVREVIRVLGVGALVKQFGPEINSQFNRLSRHRDTDQAFTKVVPIISIGLNTRRAVGAAQVMGPRRAVERVRAVASPETDLFGGEIRIRAMIPVDRDDVSRIEDIKAIPGVGVSGIVDLKL